MKTLTEKEVLDVAIRLFPTNKEMRSSFISGAYRTINIMKKPNKNK